MVLFASRHRFLRENRGRLMTISDLAVERAVRQLARDAGISREELLDAIVRDWLIEHRCIEPNPSENRTSNVIRPWNGEPRSILAESRA